MGSRADGPLWGEVDRVREGQARDHCAEQTSARRYYCRCIAAVKAGELDEHLAQHAQGARCSEVQAGSLGLVGAIVAQGNADAKEA